ncbi:hypothetical protein KSD_30450 [Ktedonobacter sp. SOSP1-85]|uniref:DUF2079 domain-containing protein n=1 Tax=Ktedonobacter sp. SOSP1-85 TaxID=2778367 RepID=UPI00191602F6|nr:DUF2079 domain-containing protein [Ktedonobacter sp. SOSP1-85]GHO75274.1 hypothetical protein KSD_30450 [Ktedonobacter sp. SOSP1-85]
MIRLPQFSIQVQVSPRAQVRLSWSLLVLAMLAYALIVGFLAVLRYTSFKATAFDLGNMDQVLWNTLHGHPFQWTNQGVDWYGPPIRLAQHFEPVLLPLSLLYVFGADPRILLIFQTLVLVSGALPIFLMTRRYLPQWPLVAAIMVLGYLLSAPLIGINLFDFHPVALVTPCFLYAFLALTYRRFGWCLLCCALAAICKEEIPFVVAVFGVLIIWKYRAPRLGLILILGGILYGIFAWLMIKHFYPGNQGNNFWYRYAYLGATPSDALVNIVMHPWVLPMTYLTLERFYYLAGLARCSGFFSVFAPEWLLPALPNLALNLLPNNNSLLYSGIYHYNAPIIPFVVMASIIGLARLVALWQQWRGEPVDSVLVTDEQALREKAQVDSFMRGLENVRLTFLSGLSLLSRPFTFARPGLLAVSIASAHRRKRLNDRVVDLARTVTLARLQWVVSLWIVCMVLLHFVIMIPWFNVLLPDHLPGDRDQAINQLLASIPPTASVSASGTLNPHLTERPYVTVFPLITYTDEQKNLRTVDYIVVDLNNIVPEDDKDSTARMLNQVRSSQQFCTLKQIEGVILLVQSNGHCGSGAINSPAS